LHHLEILLQVLPRTIVETQPELLLAKAWCAHNRYDVSQMLALVDRAEALIAQLTLEPAVTRALRGEVAFFRCYQAAWASNLPGAVSQAQRALADLPLDWWHARALAHLYLAVVYHMQDDLASAAAAMSASLAEAHPNGPYLMRSLIGICFVYWLAGDLQGVADAANQMLILGEQHHYPQTTNWAHYFSGIVHYHRNNLAEAEQDLSTVVLDRYRTHLQCLVQGAMALALTYQSQQRPAQALTVADMLPAFLYETGNTVLLPVIHAFQAELALRQSHLAESSQWAAQAQPAALSLMPFFFAHPLVSPRVLLALNTPDDRAAAAEQLARLREFAESRHHTHVLIEVLAVQAELFAAQGDRPAALETLTRAIGLAQPGGFIRLFVDRGPTMQALLREVRDRGMAPYFVTRILAAFAAPQPIGPPAPPGVPELIEPLTNRELEVLELLAQRLSNKEIAASLFIAPNTAKRHILNICQKLQVNTRRDAVTKAQILGLLPGH
jgi:LuxR family maltose regulon positive regulatory protein